MPKGRGGLGSRRGTSSEGFGGGGAQNDFSYGDDGSLRFPGGFAVYFQPTHPSDDLGLPGDWCFTADIGDIGWKQPNNTWKWRGGT